MSFDIARARSETPGCEEVVHFNNSGAALMPAPVLQSIQHHLHREAMIGGYEAEREAGEAIEQTYDSLARLLNCDRNEIAVVENATAAWCSAFYGLPLERGDRILTARAEYASNYIAYLQTARRKGIEVTVIPDDDSGQLDVKAMEDLIDESVRLISITHVPTNGGLVNPAAEAGHIAREAGIPFLLDACQSVGQMPVDVETIGCDMLSGTGRKFLRGPRGTGFLYVRESILDRLDPPFLDLRSADWIESDRYEMKPNARRFENWESFVAGRIGLGVAVDYALEWGLDEIRDRIRALAERFRAELSRVPGVTIRDQGHEQCGIVSFTVDEVDHELLVRKLYERKINCSIASSSGTLLDMQARGIDDLIRAPVHYYNTEDEIELFITALDTLLKS